MATRALVITNPNQYLVGEQWRVLQWTGLLNGDDGAPAEFVSEADRSVQVEGTAGAGLAGVIEGSNDSTNYRTLKDQSGTDITIAGVGTLRQIRDLPRLIRPRITAGDGTTSLTVTIVARSNIK